MWLAKAGWPQQPLLSSGDACLSAGAFASEITSPDYSRAARFGKHDFARTVATRGNRKVERRVHQMMTCVTPKAYRELD